MSVLGKIIWGFGIVSWCYAGTPELAAQKLVEFIKDAPNLGPGFAAVIVTKDKVVLSHVQGQRHAQAQLPMTPDTPIYVASQTKAFIGLLAVKLDQDGILPIDRSIQSYWPQLRWPDGVDGDGWTLRHLLTHQVPIECDPLTFLEAYVTRVEPADYVDILNKYAKAREPGFAYDNLGYNIYAAILETQTQKTWQDWLADTVTKPLGMSKTSARTSDFKPLEVAWSHQWLGEDKGWHGIEPKTDEMMQSAGGMVISANDMAKWLQLQLRQTGPKGSGITQDQLLAAHKIGVDTDPEQRNPYELPCSGYAMGWNVCEYQGHLLYIHGGGYTGARTIMAFSPDLGVGVAVFSNSDNMTGWFTGRTLFQYLQYLLDDPKADEMAALRHQEYPKRTSKLLEWRQSSLADERAQESWGGWKWSPSKDELSQYVGRFQAANPYLTAEIALVDQQLSVRVHSQKAKLLAASKDLFAAQNHPFESLEQVRFIRNDDGALVSFTWNDETFVRQP